MLKKVALFIAIIALGFTTAAQCGGAVGCPTISVTGSPVTCYGDANGSASVSISSGSGDYTVTWSTNPVQNALSISGLVAGTYNVFVKDNCTGCTISGSYTVNTPAPILLTGQPTDVDCYDAFTGEVDLTVNGGVLPYGYQWTGQTGTYTLNQEDLLTAPADEYKIEVTDAKNCTNSAYFTISEPTSALGLTYGVTDVSCANYFTGEINITAFGGTTPYSYLWSDGSVTEDVNGLAQGAYTVLVTDKNGCTVSETNIPVNEPSLLQLSMSSTGVSCFGDNNGSVSANVSGGTMPYAFEWSSSTFVYAVNSVTLSGVPADLYSVNITDGNGCLISGSATVSSPSQLQLVNSNVKDVSCFGLMDGEIQVFMTGGSPGYTYQWSDINGVIAGEVTNSLSAIGAGNYSVLVTDAQGCQFTQSFAVLQPQSGLEILTNLQTDVLCYGMNTGGLDVVVSGGTPGYSFLWSNGAISEDINNLFSGVYTLSVTDANGCPDVETFTITQPSDTLEASSIISPVVCFGESNGSIDVNTTGGTAPYSFDWTNSTYQLSAVTEDLNNFPSDTYYMVVTDVNNCEFIDSFFISQPPLLEGSTIGVDILCKNESTGSIDLTVVGGVQPYQYAWSNGATTEDINNLPAGNYMVVVSDDNFCTFSTSVTLTEPDDTLGYDFISNPAVCHGEASGSLHLSVEGGTPDYDISWSSGETTLDVVGLTAGWYTFLITDDHGCQQTDSAEVTQPDLLLTNEIVTDVTCKGLSDGIIDISPSGGTAPYNYTWFNSVFALSSQEQDLVDFPSDVYHLELRDSLGCLTEIFVNLPEPDSLLIDLIGAVDVTCFGGSDGSLDIEVTGGNPGYQYNWSNASSLQDLIDVPVGVYTVEVTDTKSCTESAEYTIYEPDAVEVSFSVTSVTCIDQFDGTATVFGAGGLGDYSYEWNTGDVTEMIDQLNGGIYSVTATDIVGCQGSGSVEVLIDSTGCIDPVTAFSPNGDAYNDTWLIDNMEIYPNAEIQIFNKWGNLIHTRKGIYEPWDGTVNGAGVPAEVYYWIINLNHKDREVLKGNITIVR